MTPTRKQAAKSEWAAADGDFSRPSIARMYDFMMGGTRHSELDREVARDAVAASPGIKLLIWQNRKLIKRVVRTLVGGGIRQILDIGSGIPARGAVHTIAHAVDPAARVVYVDIDPVAVARGAELLAARPLCTAIQGDLTEPEQILGRPEVLARLDFAEPIALLFFNVLHFLDKDVANSALDVYRKALSAGSHLAVSHSTGDFDIGGGGEAIRRVYADAYGNASLRTEAEFRRLFGEFELIEPGVVQLPDWRPEPSPLSARLGGGAVNCYAAVGAKR
jgi:S-adenosyl methyltransferase